MEILLGDHTHHEDSQWMAGCSTNETIVNLSINATLATATCPTTGSSRIYRKTNNLWQYIGTIKDGRQWVAVMNDCLVLHHTYDPGLTVVQNYCAKPETDQPEKTTHHCYAALSAPCEAVLAQAEGWLAAAFLESFISVHHNGTLTLMAFKCSDLTTPIFCCSYSRLVPLQLKIIFMPREQLPYLWLNTFNHNGEHCRFLIAMNGSPAQEIFCEGNVLDVTFNSHSQLMVATVKNKGQLHISIDNIATMVPGLQVLHALFLPGGAQLVCLGINNLFILNVESLKVEHSLEMQWMYSDETSWDWDCVTMALGPGTLMLSYCGKVKMFAFNDQSFIKQN